MGTDHDSKRKTWSVPVFYIKAEINLCKDEWASLPGSNYDQPTMELDATLRSYQELVEQELAGESDSPLKIGSISDLIE
jgi:hypothetical protein